MRWQPHYKKVNNKDGQCLTLLAKDIPIFSRLLNNGAKFNKFSSLAISSTLVKGVYWKHSGPSMSEFTRCTQLMKKLGGRYFSIYGVYAEEATF